MSDQYTVRWWGAAANFYFVEASDDLVQWMFLPAFVPGTGAVVEAGFESNAKRLFFRLRYTDDPDSDLMQSDLDGDGLSVYQEYLLGTDPFNPDSSGDGVFDGIALKLGLSLLPPEPPAPDPADVSAPTITLRYPSNAILLP